jgi:hypothetical protein
MMFVLVSHQPWSPHDGDGFLVGRRFSDSSFKIQTFLKFKTSVFHPHFPLFFNRISKKEQHHHNDPSHGFLSLLLLAAGCWLLRLRL